MREVREISFIEAECGTFDFQDPPAEGKRRKVEIRRKDKAECGISDILHKEKSREKIRHKVSFSAPRNLPAEGGKPKKG